MADNHINDVSPNRYTGACDVGAETNQGIWGSDVIADVLRALQYEYVAVCPGSSFRGLHESIVNHLSNDTPQMVLCLHEEHAVAMAHGFAKVAERPMPVILHCNVGLMHASMAVFNAWCDRAPVVILAGTGPVDSMKRRTPVDWMHSSIDQAAIVRDYTKWDDLALSPSGAVEALLRAHQIAQTAPQGPTLVTLDQRMQEEPLEGQPTRPDVRRFAAQATASLSSDAVAEAVSLLVSAKAPLILAGRVSRSQQAWDARVELAEMLGAAVLTDLKCGAAFPTDHPLHISEPALVFADDEAVDAIRKADVILSLDWIDSATIFKQAYGNPGDVQAKVIQVSVDRYAHRGWSRDYQRLTPVDLELLSEPHVAVPLLLEKIRRISDQSRRALKEAAMARVKARCVQHSPSQRVAPLEDDPGVIGLWDLGVALRKGCAGHKVSLVRVPLGWHVASFPLGSPLDYLGYDGGAGIGSGPGMAVGSALALRGTGRLPIAVLGDGDLLMGGTALWTAASSNIPILIICANNRSYYIDEQHQHTTSNARNRPVDRAWIGQSIDHPSVDLSSFARAQGFTSLESVNELSFLDEAIETGLRVAEEGGQCFIDVSIAPDYTGYPR